MDISVSDIAKVTGGEYIGDETALRRIVSGLTWDSRTIMPDNIFLAMPGHACRWATITCVRQSSAERCRRLHAHAHRERHCRCR